MRQLRRHVPRKRRNIPKAFCSSWGSRGNRLSISRQPARLLSRSIDTSTRRIISMAQSVERGMEDKTRLAITVCLILATLMQSLDTTIANVALPYIQGSVSASQDQIAWVLTSYIAAAAIMTPPTGYLTSRFGLKRIFLFSVAGFTAASVLCGLAQSLGGV